jgi:hypothetical protein
MSTDAASIFDAALALPEADRIRLAGDLLASVTPPEAPSTDDPKFDEELARRQRQLRDATAKTYSADETIAAMRRVA